MIDKNSVYLWNNYYKYIHNFLQKWKIKKEIINK